jgi:glycerol-3-phosphate dehydrogenase
VRYELARRIEDVLARRTRALFLNAKAAIEMAEPVAKLMAAELGRDEQWIREQVEEFRQLATGYCAVL